MLDMGFKPAVDRIVKQTPNDRQTMFFSATLEGAIGQVAQTYTQNARRHVHTPAVERKADVKHRFVHLAHADKVDTLIRELNETERGRTLVFVRTKRGADRLVQRLGKSGIKAAAMHGNKSQNQRQRALANFESGKVDTLVATDVAARGIDVPDVTHVINYDAPEDRDTYVHRVGRTGRAGATGAGVSFVIGDQVRDMRRIAQDLDLLSEFDHEAPAHVTGPPREMSSRSNGGGHRGQGQGQGQGRGRASESRDGSNGNRPKARPNAAGTARGSVASSRPPRKRRSRV